MYYLRKRKKLFKKKHVGVKSVKREKDGKKGKISKIQHEAKKEENVSVES